MKREKGLFYVLGAGMLWGATLGLYGRFMSALGFTAMQTTAVRMLVSMLVFLLYGLFANKSIFKIALRDCWMFFGSGIISISAFCYFYFTSLAYAPLAVVSILLYTSPVFIMLFSALLFKERITRLKLAAMILALCGCMLVSGLMEGFGTVPLYGVVTGLLSGLTYSLYSIFARYALKKYGTLTVNLYTFVFATLATLPAGGAVKTLTMLTASVQPLAVGLIGSLLCSAVPFFLYTKGMETLDTGKAGILATTEPMISALVSVIVLQEPMSLWGALGIALVLSAIVLLSRGPRVAPEADAAPEQP
ncbi:MAG: DMT family transporter [Candidatus Pelethousia sp.]|nr:DMT family transporter [Candidatus Pelethousia sp.]